MDISVIIPSYNAMGKLERCLTSLRNQTISPERYEVIFVDDCSTDGTFAYLQRQAATAPNWQVLQLDSNSGSPSKPRNIGTDKAQGEYVFYLDCDDEILPDTLEVHFAHAKATDACIVRGYLLADDGKNTKQMNVIDNWDANASKPEKIKKIISKQSTIPCSLIKLSVFPNFTLWPENLKMGEDSVFLAKVLTLSERIEYVNHPTYIYNQRQSFVSSTTQSYGDNDLRQHIQVWNLVRETLLEEGLDYFKLRLHIGIQTCLRSLIFLKKKQLSLAAFDEFSHFINTNWDSISAFSLSERFSKILKSLKESNYNEFLSLTKPKLLIAGYDLKFIKDIIPQLSQVYDVKLDEWTGHNSHDEELSARLLEWADYIWCEWLLGNAVWYSERKKPEQKLVVRMHRFELSREFGDNLTVENVDIVVSVSVLFFERLMERFPNIPRHKIRLIHNYVDSAGYSQVSGAERCFNIAMIGIVPYRKGFHHAIELLNQLKKYDSRYRLKIFGKGPQDIPWLHKHKDEMDYFNQCENKIRQYGLTNSIDFLGHCDIKTALAEQQVGYVLSLSEDTPGFPGPESFHLAVADGFAANAKSLILKWSGVEYIYKPNCIYSSISEIKDRIIKDNNHNQHNDIVDGKEIMARYSIDIFLEQFHQSFNS